MKHLIPLLAIAALLLLPVQTRAEDHVDVQYLVLTQYDGTVSKFALSDAPILSFNGGQLVVTCSGDELSTDLADVKDYHFVTEQVPTGIQSISIGNGKTVPEVSFHNARISGLKEGARVTVYDINGKAVDTLSANAEGEVRVEIANLPKGVYILRTPTKSFKLMKN